MKRVIVETLGCKVNQFDSAAIEGSLEKMGIFPSMPGEDADICIVNTCTVTSKADRQSRQLIRKMRKENPSALLLVTGCYAEIAPQEIANIGGVDMILGNREKFRIQNFLQGISAWNPDIKLEGEDPIICEWPEVERAPRGHARALLKVQDGCDSFCSYCIVPYARGRSRSLPLKFVLERIERIASKGYKEVVLTGINLGRYGLDLNPPESLKSLVEAMENNITPPRIRLSSIEPMELDRALILAISKSEKICHHLHIPLQSGDNEILMKMKRPYTTEDFAERIKMAVKEIPDLTVGLDIIPGFPGEEDSHFNVSYSFLKGLPFTYLHVFPFSERRGTEAALLPGKVPHRIIVERSKALRQLSMERRGYIYRKNIGKTLDVLVEAETEEGIFNGITSNYIRVYFKGTRDMLNSIVPVRIKGMEGGRLVGVVS